MFLSWCLLILCCHQMIFVTSKPTEKESLSPEVLKALKWILDQRNKNFGWSNGADTAAALTALELANWGTKWERELCAKQLEIDLVLELWRHLDPTHSFHTSHMRTDQLSHYVMALTTVCHDPGNFYGYDLIGSLVHHEGNSSDEELILSSLAGCAAGGHIRKRNLRRLLDIPKNISITKSTNSPHIKELSVYLVLAFKCIIRDHKNRNLDSITKKPILSLARSQESDGGFGSVRATALAMQAFMDESDEIWNKTSALEYILKHQSDDGSFVDVATTADVIIAMSNKSLHLLRDIDCDEPRNLTGGFDTTAAIISFKSLGEKSNQQSISTTTKPDLSKKPIKESKIPDKMQKINSKTLNGKKILPSTNQIKKVAPGRNGSNKSKSKLQEEDLSKVTVSYSLWVGSNVTDQHTVNVTAEYNSTFYTIMQIAAEKDPSFKFQATEWPNGHYVHTLAGFKEEPNSYHYWLLYRLPELPDPRNPPGNQLVAPTGVDDLLVEHDDHYLFWYKKL